MFLAKSNYKPKPEKPKLTERQRFERWHLKVYGYVPEWVPAPRNDYRYPCGARWEIWQASARAKR